MRVIKKEREPPCRARGLTRQCLTHSMPCPAHMHLFPIHMHPCPIHMHPYPTHMHPCPIRMRPCPTHILKANTAPSRDSTSKCPPPAETADARGIPLPERESFIENMLIRIHCIILMMRWTGLALCEFEFPFPGSLTSTFLHPPTAPEGSSRPPLTCLRPVGRSLATHLSLATQGCQEVRLASRHQRVLPAGRDCEHPRNPPGVSDTDACWCTPPTTKSPEPVGPGCFLVSDTDMHASDTRICMRVGPCRECVGP